MRRGVAIKENSFFCLYNPSQVQSLTDHTPTVKTSSSIIALRILFLKNMKTMKYSLTIILDKRS